MTAVTSSSVSGTYHLPLFMTYVAMAPLILWHVTNGDVLTHVDLRPPQQFVPAEAAPLELTQSGAATPDRVIRGIELQLGLSKAAIADLLRVTRPSLYAWMRGGAMRPKNAALLTDLKNAANLLTRAAGEGLPALWQYQTLPNGQSFAEGVRAGGNAVEFANMLVHEWQLHDADSTILSTIFGD